MANDTAVAGLDAADQQEDANNNTSLNQTDTLPQQEENPLQDDNPTQDDGDDDDSTETPKKKTTGPYVRYRTEYRDTLSDILISSRDTDGPEAQDAQPDAAHTEDDDAASAEPVFEVVTTIRTRLRDVGKPSRSLASSVAPSAQSKPRLHINIYSAAILNALESVVEYYPLQSLAGDPVEIGWPYPLLVHHYDELAAFRDRARDRGPDEGCHLERRAVDHLTMLLDYLDRSVMPAVREEQDRNRRGLETWENCWVRFKPGSLILIMLRGHEDWTGWVVHGVTGGMLGSGSGSGSGAGPYQVTTWSMKCNGVHLSRAHTLHEVPRFNGERKFEKVYVFSEDEIRDIDRLPEVARRKAQFGEQYLALLQKQCMQLKGPSRMFPYNEHDGLAMVDIKDYLELPYSPRPEFMDQSDLRPHGADGSCHFCNIVRRDKSGGGGDDGRNVVALFEDFDRIPISEATGRTSLALRLLCPVEVHAFVFKTREWEPVHVQHLSAPFFEEKMIDGLVMAPERKNTLISLAKSFARRNKHGGEVQRPIWSADFVKGKGNGLIFLLHGRPGVGKTCTAECIASYTRRPLMVLTSGDIGNTPSEVELSLTRMFKRAVSWDAVLLIDEADVFMEQRSTRDLTRNSLVAGFLRALENYDGILFLTTNRIGAFDDAFMSRVHMQLYYPEFTDVERTAVWKTFITKLERDRGEHIRLHITAKEYIGGKEMQAVEWNGREIRNALQTAVALAEYDAETDTEGKILIKDAHLKAIVDLSADFKKYLNSLHEGDEGKRAERKYERLGTFDN